MVSNYAQSADPRSNTRPGIEAIAVVFKEMRAKLGIEMKP